MFTLSETMRRKEAVGALCYLAFELLLLPRLLLTVNAFLSVPVSAAVLNYIAYGINFLCTAVICRGFLCRSGKKAIAQPVRTVCTAVAGFAVYRLLFLAVSQLILYVYPAYFNVNDSMVNSFAREYFPVMLICTVFLVPITEETLFRGLIFGTLHKKSRIAAYALSAAAFSIPHILGMIGVYPAEHILLGFIQYLPAGICLGLAYAVSGTIWAPILIHSFVNLYGILTLR